MSKCPGLIDSHCHLTAPQFSEDLDEVLRRAQDASVIGINVVGYTVEHSLKAVELAKRSENLRASIGVSPHDANKAARDFDLSIRTMAAANRDSIVAIGETGLDFHHLISPQDVQIESFVRHIQLAVALKLPLVIHVRDAFNDARKALIEHNAMQVGGVFHCFTGTPEEALEAVELGFYVSFSGIVTFKTARQVRESATAVPDSRLLVETDAPYLAPSPMRGKRNEPAFLVHVIEALARIRNETPKRIGRLTAENARRLFLPDQGLLGQTPVPATSD
ncbi:MAG: TatD family hydrolase [Candidatus Coatesbacteria bacterium]|nr:TatD family hydrolase [Candidatus Coatesbacteria bacterium]